MAPCTHPGMKRFFCLSQKTASVASLLRPCLTTSREVNEARWPHTCSRPCAFKEKKPKKKKKKKSAATKTHHEIHSSPATATTSRRRAMKHVPRFIQPILARFRIYRSRVGGNRPRTARAISKYHEQNGTHMYYTTHCLYTADRLI